MQSIDACMYAATAEGPELCVRGSNGRGSDLEHLNEALQPRVPMFIVSTMHVQSLENADLSISIKWPVRVRPRSPEFVACRKLKL